MRGPTVQRPRHGRIGYAYTAQYTSDDNPVTASHAYDSELTPGDVDYNTQHNDKTDVYVTTVGDTNNTISVNVNTEALDSGTFDVAIYGVKITFIDGTDTGTL